MKDLIVLCADKDAKLLLEALLPRLPKIEPIRPLAFDIYTHQQRDTGVLNEAHNFLRPFATQYAKALVVWDVQGCGQEGKGRLTIEAQVAENIAKNGWMKEAVCTIAIDPELENWIWGLNETRLKEAFGWEEKTALNRWVQEKGFWPAGYAKPPAPKEAVEAALRCSRKPWSSAIHKEIASRASYKGCTDGAFLKMLTTLKAWFPAG